MWGQEQAEQNTLTSRWINNTKSSIIISSIILKTLSSVSKYDRNRSIAKTTLVCFLDQRVAT